jgi:hypothetical protein
LRRETVPIDAKRIDSALRSTQLGNWGNADKPNVVNTLNSKAEGHKSTAEQTQLQPQTSYSAMLAEATDGDTSEAAGRATLGLNRRDGLDEDGVNQAVAQETTKRTQRGQAVPVNNHNSDASTRAAKQSQAIENSKARSDATAGVERVRISALNTSSLGGQHDQLMMLASTMSRRELATFIAKKSAARLETIFNSVNWKVTQNANLKLTANQMLDRYANS